MAIRPLRGQTLIQMLPASAFSDGGVFIPESIRAEPTTEFARAKLVHPRGDCAEGIVREIGPWPQVRKGKHKGFQIMPEFKVGDRVVVKPHAGQEMRYQGVHYRLVDQLAVLAVL